jgi:hypothetical protein
MSVLSSSSVFHVPSTNYCKHDSTITSLCVRLWTWQLDFLKWLSACAYMQQIYGNMNSACWWMLKERWRDCAGILSTSWYTSGTCGECVDIHKDRHSLTYRLHFSHQQINVTFKFCAWIYNVIILTCSHLFLVQFDIMINCEVYSQVDNRRDTTKSVAFKDISKIIQGLLSLYPNIDLILVTLINIFVTYIQMYIR